MKQHFSVIHVITSQSWGGLELYVVTLAQKIQKSGLKTAIYCLPNTKVAMEAKKRGIPLFHGIKQARISVKDILSLKEIVQKESFDVLHAHTRQDVWLCSLVSFLRFKSLPVVFSLYMSAPKKKDLLHRMVYSRVGVITSSSTLLNQQIKKNFPVRDNQVRLLRYGMDCFQNDKNNNEVGQLRGLWNTKPDQIVVLTMCRLDPQKGVKELAESLLLLSPAVRPRVKLWIMGEPTLKHLDQTGAPVYEQASWELFQWLLNFIKDPAVKGQIEWIPFQKNPVPYLEAADVFALLTDKETYSLSVLDAMNHGLAVIGTNAGGTIEQLGEGSRGILVQPKDPAAVARAIEQYVEVPALKRLHGDLGRSWVQSEHHWDHSLQCLNDIYQECTKEQP